MNKKEILEICYRSNCALSPDSVCRQLAKSYFRSSVYSYLFRLHKQGLLNRTQVGGRVAYSISERGIGRLNYFKSKGEG